jgi:hypothetical protein
MGEKPWSRTEQSPMASTASEKPGSDPTAALCAIMKNEGVYILEWLAFHRVIGFDEIFIYNNESTDTTAGLLAPLQAAGLVKVIPWPSVAGIAPQRAAYADVLSRTKCEWVCFIDADEFINLKCDDSIHAFLQRFPAAVSAIAMNWRLFGSSGRVAYEADLVTKRFNRSSRQSVHVNKHCKTIARVEDIGEIHIHRCFLKSGLYVDESGEAIEIQRLGFTPGVRTNLVQINHYVLKSKEEFTWKQKRGNANRSSEEADKYLRLTREFFTAHDLNDEEDLSIHRFDARLEKELSFLRSLLHN